MRPLTRTLSRAEASALLDIAEPVLDALLDHGHLLCQFQRGEPRIPLAQLEEFFRERLVRVYQAEAAREEWRVAGGEELRVASCESPPPEPGMEMDDASREDVLATRNSQLATATSQLATSSSLLTTPPESPLATRHAPPATLPDERRLPRYIPMRQVDGIFDDVKFTILQISATGLRIRHREPLVPGTEAKLTFALLRPARSVVVRMRVVWTSLARSGEERFSISGLRVIEHGERLAAAVESLRAAHELQPERRIRHRRADDATIAEIPFTASDEEIALVTSAMQRFASDPVEANRWYARARFALADETIRRSAPQKPRERDEVLGLWEYLERQVELEKVAGIVAWTRGAAAAGPPN